jgi:hypothetical protein
MNLILSVSLTTGRLRINDQRNGRRTWYGSVTIGRRTWFVSRWDTIRVRPYQGSSQRRNYMIHVGPIMSWYCGSWSVS